MNAVLREQDRTRVRAIAKAVREYRTNWRNRILSELRRGPATRAELWAHLTRPTAGAPSEARRALSELLAEGAVIERPELQPARRCVVDPVMVLEVRP